MSNVTPTDMDSFLPLLATTDTKMRLSLGAKLLSYTLDSTNSIVCSDIGLLIDYLIAWLRSSNHKVVQLSLEILMELVNCMRNDFQPYLTTLLPHLVDKLEDGKEIIREKASVLFLKLVDCDVIALQNLFDRISNTCFTHKNSNVREQIMFLLCTILDTYGASSLTVSKLVPSVVKLLSDPNASVRSTAVDTLCKIYRHVGERLRRDLLKKNLIPPNKLSSLMNKFDEIRASEDGLRNAFQSLSVQADEVDQRVRFETNAPRKLPGHPPTTPSSAPNVRSKIPSASKATAASQGGVDRKCFEENFEKVPPLQIYCGRDVDECLKKYQKILNNENEGWSKRVDCLKNIRSLIAAGASNYDEFLDNLNTLLPPLQASVKDLRSMVVREACITVAYLSKTLKSKFDHFAESMLSSLINLIQNSKKVIATSGLVCICFILEYTHTPRLIPIITSSLDSKSKDIRCACSEFVNLLLQTWNVHLIERHASVVQEAIRKGIIDADRDTRLHARKAYTSFAHYFPDLAESLKNSLDFSYRKLLAGDGSNGGSSSSLSRYGRRDAGSSEMKSLPRAANVVTLRSNSAIDLQAVKLAKTRAQYTTAARQKVAATSTAAPSQSTNSATSVAAKQSETSEQRAGRHKSRISISQPTSRSGSPSSRLCSYSHYLTNNGNLSLSRKSSVSNDSSRETSPNQSLYSPVFGCKSRLSTQPLRQPVIAQKILQRSREAESELAYALGNMSGSFQTPSQNPHSTPDNFSDESEASSMCSEHSFDSYRRLSDSASWNGSQHRLYRDTANTPLEDIGEIIASCENPCWNERKKGLISLQYYLQDGNKLELFNLKRITDVFLKIFNDPHIKVFSLFLDTLNELILSHNTDLRFCLHLLLMRLFNKLGNDLLSSVHSKVTKILDTVFASFPHDLQIQSVFRFLIDPTQTPNTRVKLAALNYLIKLTTVVDPRLAFSASAGDKDYATLALTRLIDWAMPNNAKSTPELRKAAQETVHALQTLNKSQTMQRLSSMPADYRETAFAILHAGRTRIYNSSFGDPPRAAYSLDSPYNSVATNLLGSSVTSKAYATHGHGLSADDGYSSSLRHKGGLPPIYSNDVRRKHSTGSNDASPSSAQSFASLDVGDALSSSTDGVDASAAAEAPPSSSSPVDGAEELKRCVDQLSRQNDDRRAKQELLARLTSVIDDSQSEAVIAHFKPLLGQIVSSMTSSEPALVKEAALNLLQTMVKCRNVTFLLRQFSDLVITKVLALCGDESRHVVKAAENCAVVLSAYLPAESVVRVVVPLIASEAAPVKLVAVKMLTRLVECADDDDVVVANVDQIMPVLLAVYDDVESSVRKAAVFCIVALYQQSEEMKVVLEPYIATLQGAKLKLLQLYINRAEPGSSTPTSPKTS